ncbi:MAG: hypothetical protein ACHQEM_02070 [Chitinophagales bacterium]
MGKLMSWGLDDTDSKICSFCGMQKAGYSAEGKITSNHCCKDEHKHISAGQDQKGSTSELQIPKISNFASVINSPALQDFHIPSSITDYPKANGPPRASKVPVFVLNCNHRI